MHVFFPYEWENSPPNERIFMKSDIWNFLPLQKIFVEEIQVILKCKDNDQYSTWRLIFTYDNIAHLRQDSNNSRIWHFLNHWSLFFPPKKKFVAKIQVILKCKDNDEYSTWRLIFTYDNIAHLGQDSNNSRIWHFVNHWSLFFPPKKKFVAKIQVIL